MLKFSHLFLRSFMRVLSFSILFLSFSALACPELKGLYSVCKSTKGERSKLRIDESLKEGTKVFKISWSGERTQIHIADGVTRVTPIFETGISLRSTALCQGDVFHRTLAQEKNGQIGVVVEQEYSVEKGVLHFTASDEKGIYKDVSCRK
jgi:hypothetical protein